MRTTRDSRTPSAAGVAQPGTTDSIATVIAAGTTDCQSCGREDIDRFSALIMPVSFAETF